MTQEIIELASKTPFDYIVERIIGNAINQKNDPSLLNKTKLLFSCSMYLTKDAIENPGSISNEVATTIQEFKEFAQLRKELEDHS